MAKRYVRTLVMDRLGDELEIAQETADTLASNLRELAANSFSPDDGWKATVREPEGNEVLIIDLRNDTFEGEVRAAVGSDLKQGEGQMVRQSTLRVSAQCSNSKRRNAREFQIGMEQKTGTVIGVVCGVGLAVLLSLGEILLVGRLHIYLPVIAFVVGYGIGYAIGHMSGGAVGGVIGKSMAKTETGEERAYDAAMNDWEAFVDSLVAAVDEFAEPLESTPSGATIV